jgi:pyridoxal phosphate enzyme (YggS family)
LLAVSKRHPLAAIREAADCGQRDFGENFVQEALDKIVASRDLDLTWHFIGHLQSNKTRSAAEHFSWIHSIDRVKIARRLNDQRPFHAAALNVCLQVCLEDEPGKGGARPDEIGALARAVAALPRLRLRGLMAIRRRRRTSRLSATISGACASCSKAWSPMGWKSTRCPWA